MYIFSPLEQFEIKPLIIINNNLTLSITNYTIYLLIISFIIYNWINIISNIKLSSNRWVLALISIYDTIYNLVQGQIGNKGNNYFPLCFTLFNFIVIANLISMVPYSFAISAQLVAIISLSLTIWLGNLILGFKIHGLKFFSLFVPSGTPLPLVPILVLIETLSYTSRAISLGLRLSANILSGHLLMFILGSLIFNLMSISLLGFISGIIPILGVIAIVILEIGISIIQGYVFTILTTGYLKDSLLLH
uniref:ATP synthase subunit a n=1 Tax=[Candida] alai TaxID=434040 RepID=E3VW14_9ASCO|nr:ATP synthase F0 subunit a [[Candida] alai]YP_003935018.1 ATP synthase F0 subunit a [[Candida] alai]ADO51037.1 ATP synthase F0 subunit a [[Candida] alai]ADO51042.1 ATP synthase F0 subunit a [[Candida] alai]